MDHLEGCLKSKRERIYLAQIYSHYLKTVTTNRLISPSFQKYSNMARFSHQSKTMLMPPPQFGSQAAGTFRPSSIKKIAASGTCK